VRSGTSALISLLTVWLTACQAGGLEIIVYPPADPGAQKIDEIRVYTGVGYAEMTRMGTVSFAPDRNRRGGLWGRDLDAGALPYESKKLSHDTEPAEFVFAARGDGDRLSVIALGLTHGQVTSAIGTFELAIPSDYVAVYRVGLNAASTAKPGAPAMTQVELWGEPNEETCVQLIDNGGYHDERYPISFITTPHDEDCDGLVAGTPEECDDHFYKGFVKPSTATLTCLNDDKVGTPGTLVPACRVGGPICADGTPASSHTECSVDHPYCAPNDLCARCNKTDFDHPFEDCAIDPVGRDPTGLGSRYTCRIPIGKDLNGSGMKVCPHTLSIPLPFPLTALTCTSPMFHGPKKDDGWRGRIDVGNGTYTLGTAGTAGQSCAIVGTPTKLPDDLNAFSYGGLISIDLTAGRGVVVPLVLELEDGTTTPCSTTPVTVSCQDVDSASVLTTRTCLEQAPPTGP
jgi:hypothetical protein